MHEYVLSVFANNLATAKKLVADLSDDQMAAQPVPGKVMNHAAFILGHLAWTSDVGVKLLHDSVPAAAALGVAPWNDEGWKELFAMNAQPQLDGSKYPSKEKLLAALEDGHHRFAKALYGVTPEILAQPAPERVRSRFPSLGHLLIALLTSHEATHLGQLSAWRRALGLPPV
ncbi:MAG TPA: DinB family protein [Pirellulales bacterium]|nr:DinB family protein [Pirellulales bacterium]